MRALRNLRRFQRQAQNEIAFLRGTHRSRSMSRSVILFTSWRSASVYTGRLVETLASSVGLEHINVEKYYYSRDPITAAVDRLLRRDFDANCWKSHGYYYGPFRSLERFPFSLENDAKKILFLRDPRDVLTSSYFSSRYSHGLSRDRKLARLQLERRRKLETQGVDEAVLENASNILRHYTAYCSKLLSRPEVFFTKYEQMVADFPSWLTGLIRYLEWDVPGEVVQQLSDRADFKVKKEDVHAHKRQVVPGDHGRKLKPETIHKLNELFQEVCSKLGYPS